MVGKGTALIRISILESENYKESETLEIVIDVKEREMKTNSETESTQKSHTDKTDDSAQPTGDFACPEKYVLLLALTGMFMTIAAVCIRRKKE